jgi:pilus assembly protein CpaC
MGCDAPLRAVGLLFVVLLAPVAPGRVSAFEAQAGQAPSQPLLSPLASAQTDSRDVIVVIKSQHKRLSFSQDIRRLAVGDTEILSADLITSSEVLALGKQTGRTTLIVWFANGSSREYVVSVQRDLAVLERAIKLVNPSIRVESAPDRDALVLTGLVPDITTSQAAEAVARNYLDAGGRRGGSAETLLGVAPGASPPAAEAGAAPGAAAAAQVPVPSPAGAQAPTGAASTSQVQGVLQPSGTIINLIQLEALPPLPEQRLRDAIRPMGGAEITVRRVLRGDVRDDSKDTLVLEGRVANQTVLVRVLTLAAQLFTGQTITTQEIRVVADEGGGLTQQTQGQQGQQQSQSLGGGTTSALGGGSRGGRLSNQVQNNFGRAKAVEVANGRVLSFIEVIDLPQVRVHIRLEEVNRSKLRAASPNSAGLVSSFRQPSLNPAQSATAVQGDQAARVGSSEAAIQNVLSFLNGGFLNELQYSGAHFAIGAAFSLLERQGIARSLSSPSLTVLSGEMAQVQVGGEVPVPAAFAPALGGAGAGGGTATPGVFSSVDFVPFGVQLQIRPLVGEDDTITLDVQPLIVTPDAVLTDTIRQSTGGTVPTTAFQTRALRTTSRLRDGEALVIGGLWSNNTSTNQASTPWLWRVPILGKLLQSSNRNDQTTELVIVVSPVILRNPIPGGAKWSFPDRSERMNAVLAASEGAARR